MSWLTEESWVEPIVVTRAGVRVGPCAGGYDPKDHALYLADGADVQVGDVVVLRGRSRRVVDLPERWLCAGVVVTLAEETAFPDRGVLLRLTAGGWDNTAKAYVEPGSVQLWAGECVLTSVDQGTDGAEVAEQIVTTQSFTVETPVALVDVRPDDVFTVTASADPRLIGRRLSVTRVQADSAGSARVFRAIDNQG